MLHPPAQGLASQEGDGRQRQRGCQEAGGKRRGQGAGGRRYRGTTLIRKSPSLRAIVSGKRDLLFLEPCGRGGVGLHARLDRSSPGHFERHERVHAPKPAVRNTKVTLSGLWEVSGSCNQIYGTRPVSLGAAAIW